MGHTTDVLSRPVDPRPFVQDTELQWQAHCRECAWVGPVRQHSEHEAHDDAVAHQDAT